MSTDFVFDVFLSHNSKDKPRVRKLAKRLRESGLSVWFDEWAIQPGDDIYLMVEQGLQHSRALVLCISKVALESNWVALERSTVLFRDPTNVKRRFVPLLLGTCEIPDTLRRYKFIDFRRSTGAAFHELLTVCSPVSGSEGIDSNNLEDMISPVLCPDELKTQLNWIGHISINPDGKWLVAGQATNAAQVMDLKSLSVITELKGHSNRTMAVCLTPNGKIIISGSDDHTLRIWDASQYCWIHTLHGHNGPIRSVTALSDNQRVLSASDDGSLKLWDLSSGGCLQTFFGHKHKVSAAAVSPLGWMAVSGGSDGELKLWDLDTGKCVETSSGHSAALTSIQVTPDGKHAVSASEDWTIKVWDLDGLSCAGTLEGHHNAVNSVAISHDGTFIASASSDGTVRLWDYFSGECVLSIGDNTQRNFVSIAFTPDGTTLVAGESDIPSSIHIYHLKDFKSLSSISTRRYVNAKVVLLGESGTGKSGLAHRLIQDKFVSTYSTHGMNVWRLDLPIDSTELLEREALLWDLAGQDDYRLIHQLFLNETAVAVILVNPQRDDLFAGVGDWIKALHAAVASKNSRRQVAKLLIAARIDVGTTKISAKRIDQFVRAHGFSAYLPTSAKRGDNCSDRQNGNEPSALKRLIAQHIPWQSLPWTTTPTLLVDIKNAILDMKEQEDIRLIRFAELFQRLENMLAAQTIYEADVRTAVTLLGNQGILMPLDFGDLVLMFPEVLNTYAGAVIRAARAHPEEIGTVAELDVLESRLDLDGVDRLTSGDEILLMRALVQTLLDRCLCIAEETTDGRQLIFPSQYRREIEIPFEPQIYISYTFSGELQTIYATLIVRLWYSRKFKNKTLWKSAAEFIVAEENTLGLTMERRNEGEGMLSVFFGSKVTNESRAIFTEYIYRHLLRHAQHVKRDRHYVCLECNAPVRDLELVRKRKTEGKIFITCQNCEQKVALIDSIDYELESDPIARGAMAMDQTASKEVSSQVLQQIIVGHLMAVCAEANQVFRLVDMPEYGIDGEIRFKADDGNDSGQRIFIQIGPEKFYRYYRSNEGTDTLKVIVDRYWQYWIDSTVNVYLVMGSSTNTIQWMNVSRQLLILKKQRDERVKQMEFASKGETPDVDVQETLGRRLRRAVLDHKKEKNFSWQIEFHGERLDAAAVWKIRDELVPHQQRIT